MLHYLFHFCVTFGIWGYCKARVLEGSNLSDLFYLHVRFLLYGCETWTMKKAEEKRIEAAELWFYRRLLRVSWKDRRTNDSILEELGTDRKILPLIKERKLKYLGHASRNTKTSLMKTILEGKTESRRGKGRPPASYQHHRQMHWIRTSNHLSKHSEQTEIETAHELHVTV